MSRSALIFMFLSVILAGYLGGALTVTAMMTDREEAAMPVVVIEGSQDYITADEILKELPADSSRLLNRINLDAIEKKLIRKDNIEDVQAVRSYIGDKGRVKIFVTPMIPVARVFSSSGKSFYINRAGKRLTANARFHVDVPVVTGNFDSPEAAERIMPLLDYMEDDRIFASMVSSIILEPDGDIIINPIINGHVINFGEAKNIKNKVRRLSAIYRKVLPVKGWNFYDTLSVKWDGQVVATKRRFTPPPPSILYDTEPEETEPNLDYLDTIPDRRPNP